jgi:hypothetical protein
MDIHPAVPIRESRHAAGVDDVSDGVSKKHAKPWISTARAVSLSQYLAGLNVKEQLQLFRVRQ